MSKYYGDDLMERQMLKTEDRRDKIQNTVPKRREVEGSRHRGRILGLDREGRHSTERKEGRMGKNMRAPVNLEMQLWFFSRRVAIFLIKLEII